jgi:hypothetical protein
MLQDMYPARTGETTDNSFGSLLAFVSILQDSAIDLYKDILRAVEDLATCPYTNEAFSELLAKIQAAVSSIVACYLGTIC